MPQPPKDELPDDVAEKRARETIARSFKLPHKPHKQVAGDTPAAAAQARRRAKDRALKD
jgi:hypothetical protein